MKKKLVIAAAAAGVAGAYLAAIAPRIKDRPEIAPFYGKVFAHRGMHGGKVMENTIEAFEKAVENGYGIELDVQLSADGQAVVFHDYTLFRLFGETKSVCELTAEELAQYGIPTLEEALKVIDGKVPLIVELKGESGDVSVAPITAEVLDEYSGDYCVESFNPMLLRWFAKHRPDMARGQLVTDLIKEGREGSKLLNFALTHMLLNFLSRPDFIACDGKYQKDLAFFICRKIFRAPFFLWTVRKKALLEYNHRRGDHSIFENFEP
jgi:glycerophosphoryl diester phosphodiesterase